MRGPRNLVAGACVAVLLAGSTGASAVPGGRGGSDRPAKVEHRVVFALTDEDITESSGLLDAGRLMYTFNDSGGDAVLYSVDKRSGHTVAVSTYSSGDVEDVEAIAPAADGGVWVGDIGDNDEERESVEVYRTQPLVSATRRSDALDGRGPVVEEEVPSERFSLTYPDSAHNAETLLVHPRSGRLYVVTKELGGAVVFAAPRSLDADAENELTEVGAVPGYVVDGAFFPDGRHLMLRGYGAASVYTFPDLGEVGTMRLPAQQLGEGLAISDEDEIYLSSEGVFSEVLRILLPPEVARAIGDRSPQTDLEGPSASPIPPSEVARPPEEGLSTGDGAGVWIAAGIFVLALAGWLAFTVARQRSRRIR